MAKQKKSPAVPPLPHVCSGGLDVRNKGEGGLVPANVREEILFDAGPINASHLPHRPLDPNPDYPSGKLVVIPFATTDYPPNPYVSPARIKQRFFGSGRTIASYFGENSWGRFMPSQAGPSDWVFLPGPLRSFGNVDGPELPRLLEAVASRATGLDWSGLDTNGDGVIRRAEATFVFLVCNADSALTRGNAHTRKVRFTVATSTAVYRVEQSIVLFSLVEAADPDPATRPFRTFSTVAHELCHAWFDLPDRYGSGGGTGRYDIMSADRSWEHMNMHDKMKLGWIQPRISYGHYGGCLAFPASASTPAALVVVSPAVTPAGPGAVDAAEYWIVENRHRASSADNFDSGLPESGLAIWWVGRGGWSSGHDDVRLVDFSKPDKSPRSYGAPRRGALLSRDAARPVRILLNGAGGPTYAWIRAVSTTGVTMFAEL